MSYSDFTLEKVKKAFKLTVEQEVLFTEVAPLPPSNLLSEWLQEYQSLALAINTEKSRSEFLIAPILGEIRKHKEGRISLFSGINFDVDAIRGLSGFCDYLISASPEQLYVEAPVVIIVEAKNENIKAGLGQCIASMFAARVFNLKHQHPVNPLWGCVSTGQIWRFIKLEENVVTIDATDYYINDVPRILGIFNIISSDRAL